MCRNIVIFSDGTGQRGGVLFDENRSNVYKLYRASRCAPDSCIDPAKQLAFYDPGLGTVPLGNDILVTLGRRIYNLVSQAFGLGLTGNIVDCYAALIQLWQPGDRIFLFGFSRGAYTVRCLAGVLRHCGIPTSDGDQPLRYDETSARKIAKIAVKRVYQFTESRPVDKQSAKQKALIDKRLELAAEFRARFRSEADNAPGRSNAEPYFIGVFDTVASLSNPEAIRTFSCLFIVLFFALTSLSYFLLQFFLGWSPTQAFLVPFLTLGVGPLLVGGIAHTLMRLRFPSLAGFKLWPHLTEARMRFYDTDLSDRVDHARHALSIDERRASFQQVAWGRRHSTPKDLVQQWFAGNHADVGGGYAETEARLSDASLKWMADAARECGLKLDPTVLNVHPDARGMQHDEARSSWAFRFARKKPRNIPDPDAPLHAMTLARFACDGVLQFDLMRPYRPDGLRENNNVRHFYEADDLIGKLGAKAEAEARARAAAAQTAGDTETAAHWLLVTNEIARRQRPVAPTSV